MKHPLNRQADEQGVPYEERVTFPARKYDDFVTRISCNRRVIALPSGVRVGGLCTFTPLNFRELIATTNDEAAMATPPQKVF
jgi:hypothetical protein